MALGQHKGISGLPPVPVDVKSHFIKLNQLELGHFMNLNAFKDKTWSVIT